MLTYEINGRTMVYRAPSSEEQDVVGALLDAGFHVAVRSDRFRRWQTVAVQDRRHLAALVSCEAAGCRSGWHREPTGDVELGRPQSVGWYKDGHPLEEVVRKELADAGAVPVGARRLAPEAPVLIGPGSTLRGRPGRRQRYWMRFWIPDGETRRNEKGK